MTPTFRYPTHELLFVSGTAGSVPVVRAALAPVESIVAVTTLMRLSCLKAYLEAEDSTCPDLILLDLPLPELLQALAFLKDGNNLRQVPVAALVSGLTAEECRTAYEARVNCCLPKPANDEELTELVQQIVDYWFRVACLPSPDCRRSPGTLDW